MGSFLNNDHFLTRVCAIFFKMKIHGSLNAAVRARKIQKGSLVSSDLPDPENLPVACNKKREGKCWGTN